MQVESSSSAEPVIGIRRDGKRVFDERFKQAVVDECLAGDASVASVAMSHGINANLVRKWIVKRQRPAVSLAPATGTATMLPVAIEARRPSPAGAVAVRNGVIEIELTGGRIRVRGAADLAMLHKAIELLR